MAGQLYNSEQTEDQFVEACREAMGDNKPSEAAVNSWRRYFQTTRADEEAAAEPTETTYSDQWVHNGNVFRINRFYWRDGRKVWLNDQKRDERGIWRSTDNRYATMLHEREERGEDVL